MNMLQIVNIKLNISLRQILCTYCEAAIDCRVELDET